MIAAVLISDTPTLGRSGQPSSGGLDGSGNRSRVSDVQQMRANDRISLQRSSISTIMNAEVDVEYNPPALNQYSLSRSGLNDIDDIGLMDNIPGFDDQLYGMDEMGFQQDFQEMEFPPLVSLAEGLGDGLHHDRTPSPLRDPFMAAEAEPSAESPTKRSRQSDQIDNIVVGEEGRVVGVVVVEGGAAGGAGVVGVDGARDVSGMQEGLDSNTRGKSARGQQGNRVPRARLGGVPTVQVRSGLS